ncbi:MAG: 2'-deoxycytidine 5'-triphosphate deaminase [Pseudomonadota bacterium]
MSNDIFADINVAGAFASQHIRSMAEAGIIRTEQPLADDQIQPASLDLRLGSKAYRVRASFLPGREKTVSECLAEQIMHEIDLDDGAVLEKSCVYIVPLQESLSLPAHVTGAGNPKSSTGRLDVFTRLITDYGVEFEQVAPGYVGPLYAEITPLTFSILVRRGSRLSQLRIRQGAPALDGSAHYDLHQSHALVDSDLTFQQVKRGIPLSVDLSGESEHQLIGYRAKRHSAVIDVDVKGSNPRSEFWEPIYASNRQLILDPGEFYILVSKEAVHIPIRYAAEMVAYDTSVGEFRVHYAGFFDPGFGAADAGGKGSRAVLEVRSFDVPFLLEHGQNVGRLVYERMLAEPDLSYGDGLSSNYQAQGLKLSKHFK